MDGKLHFFVNTVRMLLDDLNTAKEIMKAAGWANRFPDGYYVFDICFKKPLGLFFGSGKDWKEARRITIKFLHNLQFFKQDHMESLISYEAAELEQRIVQKIEGSGQGCVTICPPEEIDFRLHTLNVLLHVIVSKRFEHGDPRAENFLKLMDRAHEESHFGTSVLDFVPWLRYIPDLTFMDHWKRASEACFGIFQVLTL